MTTYNENKDLVKTAVESILNQTYKDFDFLIVVDNPDNKEIISLLKYYSEKDKRVRYIVNEKNMGLPLALNKGIDMIKTKYIARMDADDISLPERFEKQINYLENHPETALVGAFCCCIDENGKKTVVRNSRPYKSNHINICMKYMNVFVHPTFMGKTSVFRKIRYRNLRYSQDYDFTCRLIEHNCIIENIPEVLLQYRITPNVSENKIVRQCITGYYVQKFFRLKKLDKTDITACIENDIKKTDFSVTAESIKNNHAGCKYLRRHQYLKSISAFLRSFCKSKYMRSHISGMVIYSCLKKIYRF